MVEQARWVFFYIFVYIHIYSMLSAAGGRCAVFFIIIWSIKSETYFRWDVCIQIKCLVELLLFVQKTFWCKNKIGYPKLWKGLNTCIYKHFRCNEIWIHFDIANFVLDATDYLLSLVIMNLTHFDFKWYENFTLPEDGQHLTRARSSTATTLTT